MVGMDALGWMRLIWESLRTRLCVARYGVFIEVRFTVGIGLSRRARGTGKSDPEQPSIILLLSYGDSGKMVQLTDDVK